jgi:predicted transposase YbfD/YdcC
VKEQTTSEVRYFIGSRTAGARIYARVMRGPWGIEAVNLQLDVNFGEDASAVEKRNARANLAVLSRIAVSLLKQIEVQESIGRKRMAKALDREFLAGILKGANQTGKN